MCAKVAGGRHEAFPFIDRGAALRAQLAALATVLQCWRPEAALARFASSLACDALPVLLTWLEIQHPDGAFLSS